MNKEFIPYEQALALKELGFDEPCFGYYKYGELLIQGQSKNSDHGFSISAPLYQQAFRWFREKHGILIDFTSHTPTQYDFYILYLNQTKSLTSGVYSSYDEMELACLNKLIEIVKK